MKLLPVAMIGLGLVGMASIARGQQSSAPTCTTEMSQQACKQAELAKIDALLKQNDQASAKVAHAMADAEMAHASLALLRSYALAIQSAVTKNWVMPDGLPNAVCKVRVVQLPGGIVESAVADASCPFDDRGRRSVVNAVLRTQNLPYKGYESVFRRNIMLTFVPSGTPIAVSGTGL